MNQSKIIKQTAIEQAKYKRLGDEKWYKSHDPKISKKKSQRLKKEARDNYAIADSIGSAQQNLTFNNSNNLNIACGNSVKNNKSNRVSPRLIFNFFKKKKDK